MQTIFTATARVTDWKALQQVNRDTLVGLAREAGALHYRVYRNAHDASQVLILATLPDADALADLALALSARMGPLAAGGEADSRAWMPTDWDGIA